MFYSCRYKQIYFTAFVHDNQRLQIFTKKSINGDIPKGKTNEHARTERPYKEEARTQV